MNRKKWIALAVTGLGIATVLWYYMAPGRYPAIPSSTAGPVAQVQVVPLRQGRIEETFTAYGTVVAEPGNTRTFSVPFECRVNKVFVTGGQVLKSDTPLLEIEPGPEAQFQADQARIERDSAANQLKLLEQRLELKLATRQDLLQAQQRVHDAELRFRSMEKRGIDGPRVIRADSPGVVSKIAAQAGQILPAGTLLLETIGENQITVQLGVESEDAVNLKTGQAVRLFPVDLPDDRGVEGRIRLITRQVNPQTRLVDLFIAPEPGGHLLLNEYVEGRIVLAERNALIVPRAAVLPEGGRTTLYTVEKDRAVKHLVRLGVENAVEVQVMDDHLKEGQPVVVVGNSELQDGMAVQIELNR
ncbi:MAG: efflux RND transporter periplasmic adaptor subunit [Nitrospiria bacterium]